MATPREQIEAMRGLAEGWDGYGAAAPAAEALELAKAFVGLLTAWRKTAGGSGELHVSPTRVGGVLIEWEDRGSEREVDIHPDGSFGFLRLDKATRQIETRKFSPERRAVVVAGLLEELEQLLAA